MQAPVLRARFLHDSDGVVASRHSKAEGQAGQARDARGQGHAGYTLQRQLALIVGPAAPQLISGAQEEAMPRARADLAEQGKHDSGRTCSMCRDGAVLLASLHPDTGACGRGDRMRLVVRG